MNIGKRRHGRIPTQGFYLKQALSLGEGVAVHGPEVNVRLSTGDDQVGVHGMKHSCQYRVVGALQGKKTVRVKKGKDRTGM